MGSFNTVLGLVTGSEVFPGLSPRLIRLKEAATYLAVSEWTLRQMAHKSEIRFIQRKEGGPMLFDLSDLDAWIEQAKQ